MYLLYPLLRPLVCDICHSLVGIFQGRGNPLKSPLRTPFPQSNDLIPSLKNQDTLSTLVALSNRLGSNASMFDRVGRYQVGAVRDRYDREVDPSLKPWAPLAKATVRRKKRRGRSPKIGKDSMALYESIAYRSTSNGCVVEAGAPHARYFDRRRRFLGVSRSDELAIRSILAKYFSNLDGDRSGRVSRIPEA
jgi:phage gpG-like protein